MSCAFYVQYESDELEIMQRRVLLPVLLRFFQIFFLLVISGCPFFYASFHVYLIFLLTIKAIIESGQQSSPKETSRVRNGRDQNSIKSVKTDGGTIPFSL